MSVTRSLYIYKCKPNYPVISEAFVVFVASEAPSNHGNLLVRGRLLAKQEACSYAGQKESVSYLGEFTPSAEHRHKIVIYSMNGEY